MKEKLNENHESDNMENPGTTCVSRFVDKVKTGFELMTLEPVVFIDGACYWSMTVFMEVVQMEKICSSNLGYSEEICANLSAHHEENILVQKTFSKFVFYNSIIYSLLPLIFVLFMGAWSDKYGRKIPLLMTLACHLLWTGGYLLNVWQKSWPAEIIYLVTFLGALGGGPQGLLSSAIAYMSDVTSVKNRTSRVSTAMSAWYLGGPLGMLVGAVAIHHVGVVLALAIVFTSYMVVFAYVLFLIKESHGPFAKIEAVERNTDEPSLKKEDVTKRRMLTDFFNWRRVLETFKTALKKRQGSTRAILIILIISNMARRAGRGFYMYSFVRKELHWEAAEFTYWSAYRSLIAAAGSLVLVPALSRLNSITDPMLIVIGTLSAIGEYSCYGLIGGFATGFYVWLGPLAGLISNACIIALKSMATKLVATSEKGRVSAVIAATQSVMPMLGYAMYAPIYQQTVETFPAAQFFCAAGFTTLIMVTFLAIQLANVSYDSHAKDVEKKLPNDGKKPDEQIKQKPFSSNSLKMEVTKKERDQVFDREPIVDNTNAGVNNRSLNLRYVGSEGNKSLNSDEGVDRVAQINGFSRWQAYGNSVTDEEMKQFESVPLSASGDARSDREKNF